MAVRTLHCTARDTACVIRVHAPVALKSMITQRASDRTNDKYARIRTAIGDNLDPNMSCKYLHKRPNYIQVSNTRRPCVGSQKASTKLAGNSPVRPVRCCIPLYHPSSRFFCTYIMSPTRSSNSNSLLGGYGTIQRNLYPVLKLNTVITKRRCNLATNGRKLTTVECGNLRDKIIPTGRATIAASFAFPFRRLANYSCDDGFQQSNIPLHQIHWI